MFGRFELVRSSSICCAVFSLGRVRQSMLDGFNGTLERQDAVQSTVTGSFWYRIRFSLTMFLGRVDPLRSVLPRDSDARW